MKLTLNVTQENINNGQHEPDNNPIAMAAKRAKGCDKTMVVISKSEGDGILCIFGQRLFPFRLNKFLTNWIKKFDSGKKVGPFCKEFELEYFKDTHPKRYENQARN